MTGIHTQSCAPGERLSQATPGFWELFRPAGSIAPGRLRKWRRQPRQPNL